MTHGKTTSTFHSLISELFIYFFYLMNQNLFQSVQAGETQVFISLVVHLVYIISSNPEHFFLIVFLICL